MEEYKSKGCMDKIKIGALRIRRKKVQLFFYYKSKQTYEKKKAINILTSAESNEISDAKDILKELQNFYTDLYTSASIN